MSEPKSPSPEAIKAMMKRQAKVELKRQINMIRSIKETMNHDRKTCVCEGCHNYALVGTIMQNGRLFTVVRDWDGISPDEFLRSIQQLLQYRESKRISAENLIKKLEEKGIPTEQAKVMVEKMLGPIHMVFFKPPAMGLMKEI